MQAQQEENVLDDDGVVSPDVQPIEQEVKPRMRRRFVRRGSTWLRAAMIACRPGESVFVRHGPGRFEKIGIVGKGGKLPEAWLERKEQVK